MLNLCNAYCFWRKVTSHDIRLKVPTKQSCQQNDQEREKDRVGERRDGRKIRGGQHRYFVSLLLYHLLPLPLSRSQSLTGFFRRAHVLGSGSLAQKPAITGNRHGEEHKLKILSRSSDDDTSYPSRVFFVFASKCDSERGRIMIKLNPRLSPDLKAMLFFRGMLSSNCREWRINLRFEKFAKFTSLQCNKFSAWKI